MMAYVAALHLRRKLLRLAANQKLTGIARDYAFQNAIKERISFIIRYTECNFKDSKPFGPTGKSESSYSKLRSKYYLLL